MKVKGECPAPYALSVAPMMQWTHRHFRVLLRLLSPQALLYTEMYHARAVSHAPEKMLAFDVRERPLAVQIAGSEVAELEQAVSVTNNYAFDEVNLNFGCPSHKVQKGGFGASLLHFPKKMYELTHAVKQASRAPVSAKIRIGVDEKQELSYFLELGQALVEAGCDRIIVHARSALLNGIDAKANRRIPPIKYDFVYHLKEQTSVPIVINGEICSLDDIHSHLQQVDGVMIGRAVTRAPYHFAELSAAVFGHSVPSRADVVEWFLRYAEQAVAHKWLPRYPTMCLLRLYHGLPKARSFRQRIMQHGNDIVALRASLTQDGLLAA